MYISNIHEYYTLPVCFTFSCSFSSTAIVCAGACTSCYGWQGNITQWTFPCFRRCWCLWTNWESFSCWGGWHVSSFETVYITEENYMDIFIHILLFLKWLILKSITKTWNVTFIYTCKNTRKFNIPLISNLLVSWFDFQGDVIKTSVHIIFTYFS